MLAARGVSLGLGGRINLSELNHLPRDKMMLGKLNRQKRRDQKAEQQQRAQQARLVVRKHVDSKTFWTACANVIVGVAIILIGLVMTVLGYFDSNDLLLSGQFSSSDESGETPTVSWFRYALRSMQYVGPVFCGVGMFLLIIACVITLESRDRHAQIIQEESTELRRSRRLTAQQKISGISGIEDGKIEVAEIRENGLTPMTTTRHSTNEKLRRREDQCRQNQDRTMIGGEADGCKLLISAQVHNSQVPKKSASTTNAPSAIPLLYNEQQSLSEASSTDVMHDYTFPNKGPTMLSKKPEGRERRRDGGKGDEEINGRGEGVAEKKNDGQGDGAVSGEQQQPREQSSLRRKSTSAMQIVVKQRTPRGTAPLARVESVVELSLSVAGSPAASPARKGTTKAEMKR